MTRKTSATTSTSSFSRFLREPLLHFALLAVLIFVVSWMLGQDEKELIVVDRTTQEFLFERERELLLRELQEEEKQALIDSFIEDELLVREARKRGFTDNSRVRALLIQNMRFFLREDPRTPTEEELRQFFAENRDTFTSPGAISYDQVFFQNPDGVPPSTLVDLRGGADFQTMGDRNPLGPMPLVKATERNIATSFGSAEAMKILAIDDRDWHGPFFSSIGAHFLRINERHEPVVPRFEDVRDWVAMQWEIAQHRAKLERDLDEIKKNYQIQIDPIEQTQNGQTPQ